jgi:hypothetical protein
MGIEGLTPAQQKMCAMAGSLPTTAGQEEKGNIWAKVGTGVALTAVCIPCGAGYAGYEVDKALEANSARKAGEAVKSESFGKKIGKIAGAGVGGYTGAVLAGAALAPFGGVVLPLGILAGGGVGLFGGLAVSKKLIK